jgi:hypothetical protein
VGVRNAGIVKERQRFRALACQHGASLALHPEAFTMFRNSRDVDLFIYVDKHADRRGMRDRYLRGAVPLVNNDRRVDMHPRRRAE